ncbi:aldolase [Paenibacillus sp. sgz302251]|uniref:aldolase n=1 Tax=Paenibacillus sp. sgz302251 TaxID=3414493 RepID=UPI003C7D7CCC
MIAVKKKVVYEAFGLKIASSCPLPELSESIEQATPDVEIVMGDLTDLWSRLAVPNERFVVKDTFVMFHIEDTVTFLIECGTSITISPKTGADEGKIRLYLLGTCMGVLLMQRKVLPLHGSAIVIDRQVYAVIGDSGAGKSTLASAFLQRGYSLVSDDVIAVSLTEGNALAVTPAYAQQKLWQESLQAFGMETDKYRPVFDREKKYSVPVRSQFSSEPLPLAGIFVLQKTENSEIECQLVPKFERLQMLFDHTYRNFLLSPLGLMDWHFHINSAVSDKIDVYHLLRPISRFTAHELVSYILKRLKGAT